MSALKSLFLGSPGEYNLLGTPIVFKDRPSTKKEKDDDLENGAPHNLEIEELYEPEEGQIVSKSHFKKIEKFFRAITLDQMHTLVHEMSHAATLKAFGLNSRITIYTDGRSGHTESKSGLTNWQLTTIAATGSMGNIAFSSCQLIAAGALKSSISLPVALSISAGAIFWILQELEYSISGAILKDHSDFGKIAKKGQPYLAIASTALFLECLIAAFIIYHAWK